MWQTVVAFHEEKLETCWQRMQEACLVHPWACMWNTLPRLAAGMAPKYSYIDILRSGNISAVFLFFFICLQITILIVVPSV